MNSSKRLVKFAVTSAIAAAISLTGASALYAGEINATNLNLRATPGGTAIGTLTHGTKVAVISNTNEWYQIAANGQTAFVSGAYVNWVPDCDIALGTGIVKCSTSVNLRSTASLDGTILASLPNGTKLQVTGIAKGWYKVSANNQTGYIHADYLSISGGAATDKSSVTGSTGTVSSSGTRQAILDYAAQFIGTPYVYGGSSPSGFDCSGFTSYVYKNVATPIARTSSQQHSTTANIAMSELLPGDLVFFGSGGSVSHVGIFVGNGQFIHSPNTGSSVKYDTLASGNYNRRFISGGRVLSD